MKIEIDKMKGGESGSLVGKTEYNAKISEINGKLTTI